MEAVKGSNSSMLEDMGGGSPESMRESDMSTTAGGGPGC